MKSTRQQLLLQQHEVAQQTIGLSVVRESDGSQNVLYQNQNKHITSVQCNTENVHPSTKTIFWMFCQRNR